MRVLSLAVRFLNTHSVLVLHTHFLMVHREMDTQSLAETLWHNKRTNSAFGGPNRESEQT